MYRDEKHYVAEWDSVAVLVNGAGVILIVLLLSFISFSSVFSQLPKPRLPVGANLKGF